MRVESSTSEPLPLGEKRVPQGSILGSLLFVLSLFPATTSPSPPNTATASQGVSPAQLEPTVQYVDDVSQVVVTENVPSLLEKAENRARKTVEWLLDNGMVLSLHKSKFIVQATRELRRTRAIPDDMTISVHNQSLPSTKGTTLLGMILDENITWSTHLWGED